MSDETFPFVCAYCLKIKEGRMPESKRKRKDRPLTLEEIADMYPGPTPQYICADCVRKLIKEDK